MTKAPIPLPSPEYSTIPQRPAKAQPSKDLQTILDHFSDENLELPVKEGEKETKPLDDVEKMWLSEEMIARYLKATKGKVPQAIKRLEATLIWRRTLGMWDIEALAEELNVEFESGKVVLLGYTRTCQPILWTWTSKNEQPSSFRQVKHMMFVMDRVIDFQLAGVPGVMFCADVSGKTQTQSGALGVSKQILSYLQAHYPERLGNAALVKMPWLGSLFVTLMWPFVDPDTRKKIHVNPDLSKDLVAKGQLFEEYGGDVKFEYSQEYFDSLIKICVDRRKANLERWTAAGGRVGLSEWDILEPHPAQQNGHAQSNGVAA